MPGRCRTAGWATWGLTALRQRPCTTVGEDATADGVPFRVTAVPLIVTPEGCQHFHPSEEDTMPSANRLDHPVAIDEP